jgi:TonB family protein
MLGQLVESSPRRVRRRLSTLVSLAAHTVVLTAAVAAARPVPEEPAVRTLVTWHPPPYPPPSNPPACTACGSRPSPGSEKRIDPVRYSVPDTRIEWPLDVPESVGPPIAGIQISSDEWMRGTTPARAGDTTSVPGREVVDREVVPLAANPVPRYPETLRAARIEGSVHARFVVDTSGRVLMQSVIVDAADHPLFAEAVIEALRRARFTPAELRGRKVPQLVTQRFVFLLRE